MYKNLQHRQRHVFKPFYAIKSVSSFNHCQPEKGQESEHYIFLEKLPHGKSSISVTYMEYGCGIRNC